jgi:hypothetical protein
MGGKTKAKKPKEEAKPPVQDTVPKEPEFTRVVDIRDPWEGEPKEVEMPKKKERGENTELGKAEVLPKHNFAERLRALRERMENREPGKYASREAPLWARPRGNKEKTNTYLDRMSRLGSVSGRRPVKKEKKPEKPMVFTPEQVYGKEEAARTAKADKEREKTKKKKKQD